jgi:methyl-accepting chemotaxis protein
MKLTKLSIRTTLILTFVFVGTTPLMVSSIINYVQTSKEIESLSKERARLVVQSKSDMITSFFQAQASSIIDLADSKLTVQALEEFSAPFRKEPTNSDWAEKYRAEVINFYSEQFGALYHEKTKQKLSAENIVSKLDALSLAAQYDFIVTNENPLGKKDLMVVPKRDSPYAQSHAKFHPHFRDFLGRHSLYDLFLVDANGRIVYSVFKETDFSTSLRNGPWSQTSLARTFEASRNLQPGQVHIEDFAAYTPSYEAPAAFSATPIFSNGKFIGSLIIQLPLDKITSIAGNRDGMGEKGEILLLGSDLKLRADTFRNKETHNVASSFAAGSKISVDSEAVRKAKTGESGFIHNTSYDGLETLAFYLPIKLENLTWYVVAELSRDEVYAGLNKIILYTLGVLVLGTLAIFATAFIFGNSIAKNLKLIAETLDRSSQEVSTSSSQSASSATELSEAATQQAASLQETMASVEEISAMVNQNAESAMKTQAAVDANQKVAEEGSKSVAEMLVAITEIKDTNEEILTQMESSNKEFGEIVKIISDIGEKTNVINEIVFQTKLLSFNASVEAARAGEHGKGFAVVAEEVGNLAQMSGNAAKEITDMLSDSIKKVNGIVENTKTRVDHLIEAGKDKIAMGQSTAEKCRKALNEITENARSVASMNTEITHASKEQAQGIQEINKAISQLDQVTQQNSAVAQQSSTQAEQLSAEALLLADAVKKLVAFVEGGGISHEDPLVGREKMMAGKVVPLVKRSPKPHFEASQGPRETLKKVASGGSKTPSSTDHNFEEF